MIISWGSPMRSKYLCFVYGKEWDREDFKALSFSKVPLGWTVNVWRASLSYDNFGNAKS